MGSKTRLSDLKALWQLAQQQTQRQPTPSRTTAAPEAAHQPPALPSFRKKKTLAPDVDFQRLMREERVQPLSLEHRRRAQLETPRPAPIPQQKLLDDREVLALAKYGDSPSPASWDIGQELESDQTFLRTGLAPDVLRKLRRGQWAIQRELDLHGMTVDEAHDALLDFLLDARTRGLRCVRIIHGKGLTSPGKTPVLKGKVRRWLCLWDDVLAYCEPEHHAGGGGAVVVLLRGR